MTLMCSRADQCLVLVLSNLDLVDPPQAVHRFSREGRPELVLVCPQFSFL